MEKTKAFWDGWETVRVIGQGGYGTVYEIEHVDKFGIKDKAAMKVIRFPQNQSENDVLLAEGYDKDSITEYNREQLNSVINEYATMMQMKGHRNIVRCEDCEAVPHEDGMGWDVYIRMELLKPLPARINQGAFSEAEIIKLGKDLCQALMLCEKKNIVHRDIKPENIFVNEYGDYKLGDFGISRMMERTTHATRTGSPRFMAPEIYKGQKYGPTVDIYSLGLVMYWMLNNYRMPFLPQDRPPTLWENGEATQKRLSGREELPAPVKGNDELKQVVLKACSYDPEERYSTAKEFHNALSAVKTEEKPSDNSRERNSEPGKAETDCLETQSDETTVRKTAWETKSEYEYEETVPANPVRSSGNDDEHKEVSEEETDSHRQHNDNFNQIKGQDSGKKKKTNKSIIILAVSLGLVVLAAVLVFFLREHETTDYPSSVELGEDEIQDYLSNVELGENERVTVKDIYLIDGIGFQEYDMVYQYYFCKCITGNSIYDELDMVYALIPRDLFRRFVSKDVAVLTGDEVEEDQFSLSSPLVLSGSVEKPSDYDFLSSYDIIFNRILAVAEISYDDEDMEEPALNEGEDTLEYETIGTETSETILNIIKYPLIHHEGDAGQQYFMCQCITTEGKEIWAYVPAQDYTDVINTDISKSVGEWPYSTVLLKKPLRISGTVDSATDYYIEGSDDELYELSLVVDNDRILKVDHISA